MSRIEQTETHVTERVDHAPHVTGRWERARVDPETGERLAQRIELACERCKDVHLVVCETGQVRRHLAAYALVHLHREREIGPRKAG